MGILHDFIFGKRRRVCPWYCCSLVGPITNIRRLVQNPERILSGLIKPGDKVIDVGPGQGFFTFPMANMAGKNGKVIAIDIQEKMLSILAEKVKRAGLADVVECWLVKDTNYGITSEIDFVLALMILPAIFASF
jgi:2-polyprenyl-3-methyl-5-hydroxy-6-metoxy-1,4-benzoquinol methylase